MDIYAVLSSRLQDFDHQTRDLQQALMLSGITDQVMERRLMAIREAIENAAALTRVSSRMVKVG